MVSMVPASVYEDSAMQNAVEAAALAFYQGWSIDAAAEFTGADSQRAERYLKRGRKLPYAPTPDEIAICCEEARRLSPRRMVGPQIPEVAVPTYRFVATDAAFIPAEAPAALIQKRPGKSAVA